MVKTPHRTTTKRSPRKHNSKMLNIATQSAQRGSLLDPTNPHAIKAIGIFTKSPPYTKEHVPVNNVCGKPTILSI